MNNFHFSQIDMIISGITQKSLTVQNCKISSFPHTNMIR